MRYSAHSQLALAAATTVWLIERDGPLWFRCLPGIWTPDALIAKHFTTEAKALAFAMMEITRPWSVTEHTFDKAVTVNEGRLQDYEKGAESTRQTSAFS